MADDVCFVVFPMIKHRPPAQISVFCIFTWIPSASMSVVCLSGERHNTAVSGDASLPMAYGSCSVTAQKTKARGWTSISQRRSSFGGPLKRAQNNIFFVQYEVRACCKNTGCFPTPLYDSESQITSLLELLNKQRTVWTEWKVPSMRL